jgi:hypothetical protein
MSLCTEMQPLRFRIVPAGLVAAARQPAAALKPFAPVVEMKEVVLSFTIVLERAVVCFDGSHRPKDKSGDWKPGHAMASWASWSKNERTGKVVVTPNATSACKQAAAVSS